MVATRLDPTRRCWLRATIEPVSESSPDSEPQPWSSTPAAARWRATNPAPAATYAGPLGEPLNYPTLLTALRPPPSDRVPELDAEAAYSSALAIAGCPQQSDGPTIYLAVADTPAVVTRWSICCVGRTSDEHHLVRRCRLVATRVRTASVHASCSSTRQQGSRTGRCTWAGMASSELHSLGRPGPARRDAGRGQRLAVTSPQLTVNPWKSAVAGEPDVCDVMNIPASWLSA